MTIEKLSHGDFITLCADHGISVNKITRTYVHIDIELQPKKKVASHLLSNSCMIGNLGEIDIYSDWVDDGYGTGRTLEEYIKSNMKINCIKIIRAKTGLGLKDSKDIVDANMRQWRTELGVTNDT